MANDKVNPEQVADVDTGKPATPIVDWDDTQMRSTYANVVNASSTREEVNLFFGTNETWKANEKREFHVRLSDRLVLTPHAAKRLWVLLGAVLGQYEKRFGTLDVGLTPSAMSGASSGGNSKGQSETRPN